MSPDQWMLLLGCAVLAMTSQVLLRHADRRSRQDYDALLQDLGQRSIDAVWFGGRPLVGWWGCGLVLFQFLRAVGIAGFLGLLVIRLLAP